MSGTSQELNEIFAGLSEGQRGFLHVIAKKQDQRSLCPPKVVHFSPDAAPSIPAVIGWLRREAGMLMVGSR